MTRRIAWAAAVLAFVTPGARLFAHPTANTEIILALSDRPQFEVTILTDLDPLVLKLEALAGLRPSDNLSIDAREGRIVSLGRTLLEHLDLRFDDRPAALDLVAIERPRDRPGTVVVRLSGRAPATPSHARWRTDLVFGSYPFVVRTSPDREVFEWLNGPERSQRYPLDAGAGPIQSSQIGRSIALGFTHILPFGVDHILFVLGLFLLTRDTRAILLQVSAFTVAHSITLGLALYGIVSAPAALVEPLIALSIAYVAFENLLTSALRPGRIALVFLFGLLHGLGFAEALRDLNLPRSAFLGTLVSFNAGVEAGQLAVIAAAALLVRTLRVPSPDYRRLVVRPVSLLIGLTGVLWVIERLS